MASASLLAALRALSVNDADAVAASLLEAEDGDESGLSLGCKRACQSLVAPTRFELL